jgi:hypothetical protein
VGFLIDLVGITALALLTHRGSAKGEIILRPFLAGHGSFGHPVGRRATSKKFVVRISAAGVARGPKLMARTESDRHAAR